MATKTKTADKKPAEKKPKKPAPMSYAAKDRHLVDALEKATQNLVEHRWHWTQDDQNDKAVTVEEYANETGQPREDVHRYAAAYDRYQLYRDVYEGYSWVAALDETSVGAATMR